MRSWRRSGIERWPGDPQASLRQMADALAAAGTTTKAGKPLSPSSVKLQLERLGLVVR